MTPPRGVCYNIDMKTPEQRLNNIIGQLRGAQKLLSEPERDCFSLLVQLKAARSAVSSLMDKIVSEEFDRCSFAHNNDRGKIEKIFKEVINK